MSVGNVGQLAVDVVLASLMDAGASTVGTMACYSVYHPALLPVVGADPMGLSEGLMTACQRQSK